jgi:hypothetical protein
VAEVDVVDFLHVALVEIFSREELGHGRAGGEEVQLLEDSVELVLGDVAAPGSVEVLERGLQHDSVSHDLEPDLLKSLEKGVLLLIAEDGGGPGVLQNSTFIGPCVKDGLDMFGKVGVTDKSLAHGVFAKKLLDFSLSEPELKGSQAGSELQGVSNSKLTALSATYPFLRWSKSWKNSLILILSLSTLAWSLFSTSSSTFSVLERSWLFRPRGPAPVFMAADMSKGGAAYRKQGCGTEFAVKPKSFLI